MQRWEYNVLPIRELHARAMELSHLTKKEFYRDADAMYAAVMAVLNKLGEDGWELVGTMVVPRISFAGSSGADSELHFKRPKD